LTINRAGGANGPPEPNENLGVSHASTCDLLLWGVGRDTLLLGTIDCLHYLTDPPVLRKQHVLLSVAKQGLKMTVYN
jgi:hypothetical protein